MAETEEAPLILNQKGVLVPPESACFEIGPLYHIRDVCFSLSLALFEARRRKPICTLYNLFTCIFLAEVANSLSFNC